MSSATENTFEYRDQHVPAHLWQLLREGGNKGITSTDLLILFAINAGVKHYSDGRGMGSFATNAYLGRAANVHEKYAQERINHMEKIGLILKVKLHGRRYLELEWSRTADERAALVGDYGEAIRIAHNNATKITKKQRERVRKTLPQSKENLTPPSKENLTPYLSIGLGMENTCSRTSRPAASTVAGTGAHLQQTPAKTPTKTFGKKETPNPAKVIAEQLLEIVTKHRKLSPNAKPKLWHIPIAKKVLSSWSFDRVVQILKWYDKNISDKYTPRCNCGQELADKFDRLEEAMLRKQEDEEPEQEVMKYTAEENDEFFGGKYWKPKLVHEEEKPISPYTEWEDDGNGDYSDYL